VRQKREAGEREGDNRQQTTDTHGNQACQPAEIIFRLTANTHTHTYTHTGSYLKALRWLPVARHNLAKSWQRHEPNCESRLWECNQQTSIHKYMHTYI